MLVDMRPDDTLAVGSACALGLFRSDDWSLVAAHLLAVGAAGEALMELAGLTRSASAWEVDRLVPDALAEAGIPEVAVERAAEVVARVLAQTLRQGGTADDHAILRTLAVFAPTNGYPGGVIGESYAAEEWLDCDCHRISQERADADALEARLRALPDLDADIALLRALAHTVVTEMKPAPSDDR